VKLIFIGSEEESLGFALAGAQTHIVSDKEGFTDKMEELLELEDAGVIIAADRYFEAYEEKFAKRMQKRAVPAVVFVPSIDGRHIKTDIKGYLSGVLGIRL